MARRHGPVWTGTDGQGLGLSRTTPPSRLARACRSTCRALRGATAYPKARGIWRDDERAGALIKDEPVIVHSYTTPQDIEDESNLSRLASFCRQMGRETDQGEIGLVIGDEYFAIQNYEEEDGT